MSRTLAVGVIKNPRFIISGNEPALLLFAFLLAALILANGCQTAQKPVAASRPFPVSRAEAREELQKRNIAFDPEVFVQKAGEGNVELIELFLRAGMSP